MNNAPVLEAAQGKQRGQEGVPEFDEAAFERAFEQAQQDALDNATLQEAQTPVVAQATNVQQEALSAMERTTETDPVLLRIRDKRPCESHLTFLELKLIRI